LASVGHRSITTAAAATTTTTTTASAMSTFNRCAHHARWYREIVAEALRNTARARLEAVEAHRTASLGAANATVLTVVDDRTVRVG
tara:strand:- start:72 stop:329 length:258 start_codon:yes stop_codon:yes gene_type:complete